MKKPAISSLADLFTGSTLPRSPALLPRVDFRQLPAFSHFKRTPDGHISIDTEALSTPQGQRDEFVTVELVTEPTVENRQGHFERLEIPWSAYVSFLASPPPPSAQQTLYLAQQIPPPHLLPSLTLQGDQGQRQLRERTAKTSIWVGYTPTVTPLHIDPDANVLCQLAGSKTVRLCAPEIGQRVLDLVRDRVASGGSRPSTRMRGEEMMRPGVGGERDALEAAVWDSPLDREQWWEARIGTGEGLYIPQGWWHAVRSRSESSGQTLNASVNWWFR